LDCPGTHDKQQQQQQQQPYFFFITTIMVWGRVGWGRGPVLEHIEKAAVEDEQTQAQEEEEAVA
jgi:hypothetical protein